MAQTVLDGIEEVRAAVGRELGTSKWLKVTQKRIDQFGRATGDEPWISVDPGRAAEGPFGATVAQRNLTLSLSNALLPEVVEVRGFSLGINYGLGQVRFPVPVLVGSRLRASVALADAQDVSGGVQTTMTITMELEGSTKPACVIESLSRYLV